MMTGLIFPRKSDKKFIETLMKNLKKILRGAEIVSEHGKIIARGNFKPEILLRVHGIEKIIYDGKEMRGPGGFPVGYYPKTLMMFSGGIDSPVASWMLWNSGFSLDFIHFNLAGTVQTYHIGLVLKTLYDRWGNGDDSTLYLVDFRDVSRKILELVDRKYKQIILKRAMYYASEIVANERGIEYLSTGESVGQVSSQTLHSLMVIEDRVNKPVFRPLAGLDKEEIVKISKEIGLFELSTQVGEYCALVIGRVVTRPKREKTCREEEKIIKYVDEAIETLEEYSVAKLNPETFLSERDIEIDFIPYNAILVDARARREEKVEGAIPIEDLNPEELKGKVVVVFCENGVVSREMAVELRSLGVVAYSLRGGARVIHGKLCKLNSSP